jgi:crotonobetainyl-CoA:carnitine CoA-transferase CaiB-like acyl-CoA transferase
MPTTLARSEPFLAGVRVLDITNALAGPYCTSILSDLGAEVIKLEPTTGDPLRRRLLGDGARPIPFDLVHRDKGSLAVNLKSADGVRVVRALAETADVLVENFRAGALPRLGLGYDDLRTACPKLVYCSISGFGQFGPMRDTKGVDLIAQAYGGLMSVTGSDDGTLAKAGYPMSDLGSGMWGAVGVLAGLLRARASGVGTHLDISLTDTVAAWALWEVADFDSTGEVPGPLGTAHRLAAPYQAFQCADGQTMVIGAVDRLWPRLCEMLSVDLDDDPRFRDEMTRFKNRRELASILQVAFLRRDLEDWIVTLQSAGVPVSRVNSIADIVNDQHFTERGVFVRDPEQFGDPTIVNVPIVADGAPRARGRAPELGDATVRLLKEVGYDDAAVDGLIAAGTVAAPAHPATAPAPSVA